MKNSNNNSKCFVADKGRESPAEIPSDGVFTRRAKVSRLFSSFLKRHFFHFISAFSYTDSYFFLFADQRESFHSWKTEVRTRRRGGGLEGGQRVTRWLTGGWRVGGANTALGSSLSDASIRERGREVIEG